jgi:predicted kinase
MSLACPNKSSKEWKMLVSQTGEDLANLAFVANGYRIPDVKTATEIKRAIAFKPLVESYAGMAHRLRKYNEQNGTSHYFTMEKAYGNTYKLEFKYNYLPVNVEKQRQRMAAKGDPLYAVNDFDADSFSNMYPINVASVKPKPPTSTPGDQLSLFSNAAETGFVKKINYTKSFLAREYFSSSNQVSTKEMLQNIANKNKVMAPIAQHLLDYADINNVNIFLEEGATTIPTPGTAIKALGMYEIGNNRIRIPEFGGFGGTEEETIVHEILHALSYKALRQNGKFTQAFQKLYEQSVKELGGYNDQTDTGEYANYNIDEFFVALFTNGPFIQKLESLPPINSEEFNNLFEEIFSYILDVLGFEKGTTLYSQAFAVASNIMQDTKQSVEAFNSSEAAYREYMQSEEYQRELAAEAEVSKQALGSNTRTGGLKPGVGELFESNPELANAVYEALGYKTKADVILPIGTSGSGKSTFIKSLPQENLVVIEPDTMRVEFTGDINDKSKDKEIYIEAANRAIQAIKEGKQVVFDTTNLTKDKRTPFIEAIKKAIPTANIQYKLMELNPELAKQRIKAQLERGENRAAVSDETINRHAESYKQMLEDIKSEPISNFEITPQQKQEVQQLYSQYLTTIFPDSQLKNINYHGTEYEQKFEEFDPKLAGTQTAEELKTPGFWFTYNKSFAEDFGDNVISVLLNIQNPFNAQGSLDDYTGMTIFPDQVESVNRAIKEGYDSAFVDVLENLETGRAHSELVVFKPKQIHILGSQKDIQGFKDFVKESEFTNIENDRVDEIIESAYTQVEAVEKKRENKINMEIMRQRQLLKNVKDSDEMTKIMAKIEKLKKESDIAEGRVILSKSINSFEDVLEFGNKEIGEIRKLLAKPAVSADDAYYAQRVLDLWIQAGDFSTSPQEHIILDEDEFNTSEDVVLPDGTVIPSIRSKFRAIASQAQDLQGRLTEVKKAHTTAFVQQYTDGVLTTEEIYKHIADVNKVGTLTLNLSRHNDPMMQTAFLAIEEANMLAQQEAAEVWQKLDTLTPKFLKKAGGNFNILKQLTADGKETGRVVHRFSTEFFDTRNTLMNNAFRAKDISGKLKKDPADIKMYFDWINANTITFDVRALFPDSELENKTLPNKFIYDNVTFTEEQKAKHIADLKAQLGEKGYHFYLQQAKTKLEKFKELRQAVYESYQMEPGLSEAEKDVLFTEWLKESSPYWGIDMNDNPSSRKKEGGGFYAPRGVRDYAIQVPRRSINGVTTKWYDKNFTKIEADDDLLEYHEFLMKTLNQMRYLLPQQKVPMMGVGVLPTIEKNLMDIFAEKGMMIGVVPFWDKMKQLQTTTDFATNVYSDVNPATKEIEKNLQVKYISDIDSEVREIVKQKKIKHKQETGVPATLEQIKVFRNEAKDYLSRQKSWDVTKIMKAYTMEVLAHKHKSLIEPQIRLLDQAFKNKKEIVTNKAGGAQKKDGEVLDKQGLANLRSAWEYFFDSTYYGIGARKVEGVGKKKLYTAQETKEKKELEGLIAKEDDAESKEFLQKRLDNLGGNKTLSGTGDAVLKYMTLKGLGYNLFSGVSNMGFGLISNLIEASGGQNYSMQNFRRASMLVTNSIGRNLSFNALFNNPNGNAIKIRTLMDKWDLNTTSTKEMFDMSNKSSLTKLKRFGPFSIQERSEYVNIAPVMIAIMMEFKAKDPSGKTVTMWDAYEPSTGKLKAGYTTEVDEVKMFQKIKRVVEMNHGDYYNQLQVKETIAGRALSQFRTWMFEGFATRFESEKPLPDYALSYGSDEPYIRKGRYRSYTKGQLLTTGAAVGTAFLPGIGTAVGAGIGYIGGRFFGMHTNDNAVSDVLFTLKQLARKLMFQKTQFGDKFSKTDAANMRKNMTELYIMLTLMGTAMVLKGLAGADDDDEDDTISNFLINQTIRLRTDISFYSNPLEFEKLTKTALPMAQLVSDVHVLFTDIGNYYGEDSADKSIFESGPFKGDPKWFIHMAQLLPGTSQLVRLYRTGDKVME